LSETVQAGAARPAVRPHATDAAPGHEASARNRSEQTLAKSGREFANFFEYAPVALRLVGSSGHILKANQAELALFGYARDEYVGRPVADFQVEAKGCHDIASALEHGGSLEDCEATVRCADGSFKHVLIKSNVFCERGEFVYFRCFTTDLTQRERVEADLRRVEAYLSEAQRLSHTASWAWSASSGDLFWSPEHFRMFGLDAHVTKPSYDIFFDMVHADDRRRVQRELGAAVTQAGDFDSRYRIVRPDGAVRHIHSLSHPVFDDCGNLVEYVGAVIDTSDCHVAEKALRNSQAELAHVTRVLSLGELTTSIAHEVNQPLAAIVTNGHACLRWLAGSPPNFPKAVEAVNRIIRDGNRAGDIIQRIRGLMKKVHSEKVPLDLDSVTREVLAVVQSEIVRHRITVHLQLQDAARFVLGSRIELQQVLLNIVVNAVDAMADVYDQERQLAIASDSHTLDDRKGVLLTIEDTGAGVPADLLEQIFNAFYTTKAEGLGMGLAISRSIVEAHGGKLWAAANPGRGAKIQFFLPGSTS